MNPPECVWETLNLQITKDNIAGKGENSLQHLQLGSQIFPMPQAMKTLAAKAAGTRNGINWRISAWNLTKSRKVRNK